MFSTTLHLRRTAKLEPVQKPTVDIPKQVRHSSIPVAGGGNSHQSALRKPSSVNRSNSNNSNHGAGRVTKNTVMIPVSVVPAMSMNANHQGDLAITTSSTSSSDNSSAGGKPPRVESKLERSNTFCKETSDNPVVLQIIE